MAGIASFRQQSRNSFVLRRSKHLRRKRIREKWGWRVTHPPCNGFCRQRFLAIRPWLHLCQQPWSAGDGHEMWLDTNRRNSGDEQIASHSRDLCFCVHSARISGHVASPTGKNVVAHPRLRSLIDDRGTPHHFNPSLMVLASVPCASSPLSSQKNAPPNPCAAAYVIFSATSAGCRNSRTCCRCRSSRAGLAVDEAGPAQILQHFVVLDAGFRRYPAPRCCESQANRNAMTTVAIRLRKGQDEGHACRQAVDPAQSRSSGFLNVIHAKAGFHGRYLVEHLRPLDCSLRSSLQDRPAAVLRAARLSRLRGNDEQERSDVEFAKQGESHPCLHFFGDM